MCQLVTGVWGVVEIAVLQSFDTDSVNDNMVLSFVILLGCLV